MSPPRIALITPMLPVDHDQTRGRYIYETARALSRLAEVRTWFIQPRYPRLPGLSPRSFLHDDIGPDYRIEGIDVEALSYPAIPGLSRVLNGVVASRLLTPRLRRFAPDLVLAYWVYPDGHAALRTARNLGIPCIVGARGSDIHVRSGINAIMTRRTIAGVDRLLTVSKAMRLAAIKQFGASENRTLTISNGFNTGIFRPLDRVAMRNKLGIEPQARLVIYVGRLVESKGLCELIEAHRRLVQRNRNLRLVLIGDGVMRERLGTLISTNGLENSVLLAGGCEPEQVAEWIAAADLLTLPSWSEGYPNVVVEAIACGRPVVATDVGGTREIIDSSNGILIPARNVDALERALDDALERSWDHTAIAAAMRRTWDDVGRETLAVCEQVIAEQR
ncbi:MAG TPA: glycosyltransferase [Dokdonella sp.]|uniref:glycosyltransferase n=1 Tax=Dokdonella sp. TaxID=2291710 RepID=UPI002D804D88|nr:glycosyltransferase [Dokdonella sp.]HET9032657.1 glycosyltransferase [Dokdonella sp.]